VRDFLILNLFIYPDRRMLDFNVMEGGVLSGRFHFGITAPAKPRGSLIFVDPSAQDLSTQIVVAAKRADLIFLSAARDGLEQIAQHLRGRGRLALIHLLADFSFGRLALGNQVLVVRSLRDYVATLARIGRAVRGGGEILVGAGGARDGQGDVFRHAFGAYAAVPVRLWDGGARRRPPLLRQAHRAAIQGQSTDPSAATSPPH
jgi:hypothetical protein